MAALVDLMSDKPTNSVDLTEMDYVRGALANAYYSGMTLQDVLEMSIHANDGDTFEASVAMLATATPLEDRP